MGRIRRIRRLFHRRLRRLFHRRLFHAYLICSYLICSDLICCSYVVFNAYGASSNVVHAIIPTTINHLREEVFERGGEQRGGEAKEEKEGIKEDQQEEKVSNEPFNRWTCMCTDDLLGKWHLCILVTVPLRLCCDPKCMVRIRSVTCIFIILL